MLGICYGMQLLVDQLGGKVQTPAHGGEYGRTIIRCGPRGEGGRGGARGSALAKAHATRWLC